MSKYIGALLVLLTLNLSLAIAGDNGESEPTSIVKVEDNTSNQGVPFGLCIKVLPALYWGAFGVQAEYPLTKKISVAAMFMAEKSDSKGYSIYPEEFQNGGYAIDIIGKYYFIGEAPEGLYGLIDFSYNTMLFYDGNTRPYTFHNRWKDFEGFRVPPSTIISPKAFNAALGVGYQLTIIPQHIIADVFLATSVNFDDSNSLFLQLYIAPSIGFKF